MATKKHNAKVLQMSDNGELTIFKQTDSYCYDTVIINPVQLAVASKYLSDEEISEAIKMFSKVELKHKGMLPEVTFETEEEFQKALQSYKDAIDPYTDYIENSGQRQAAVDGNKRLRSIIETLEAIEELPERLTVNAFSEFYIKQAYALLQGLEKRSDRTMTLLAIAWIKRMGFQKADRRFNPEEKYAFYTKSIMSSCTSFSYDMCFIIEPKEDGYSVRFIYDTQKYDNNPLYTPIFLRPRNRVTEIKLGRGYTLPPTAGY